MWTNSEYINSTELWSAAHIYKKSLHLQPTWHFQALYYVHLSSCNDALNCVVTPHYVLKIQLVYHIKECASVKPVGELCIGR